VRCPRCGNENTEDNRFCGMCGAKLLAPPLAVASVPAQSTTARASANASPAANAEVSSPPRVSAPEDSRGISGPSFLGLSDAAHRQSGNLSSDRNSGNLDYLLEDDEPRRSGGGKFVLILFALALAVLFGYLRFKVLKERPGKAPAAPVTDSSSATPPAVSPESPSTPAQPAGPAAGQPAASPAAQPAGDSAAPSTPPASNAGTASDAGNPPAGNSAPPAAAAPAPPAKDAPAPSPAAKQASPAAGDASSAASDSTATSAAGKESDKDGGDATDDTPPAPAPKPKKTTAEPAAKPPAGVTPKPTDSVTEAQKYIYGRGGVAQDCERGMRLLKPAAAQANPKAMIEMGALYSAGLCTPHDLPTAYRWFAMALRKEPDNQSVQADLQKLWGEMTPPERQLAIKLSQ
jgi:hypothetical protein